MNYLINIDNGGTLTDICVANDNEVFYTKTLTTPTDLSECFFTGMNKAAEEILGEGSLATLLQQTALIRYSSTQGTNALVERKGPSIGIITDEADFAARLQTSDATRELFGDLVGDRVAVIDSAITDRDGELVQAINSLTTAGAERLIVAISSRELEKKYKQIFLKRFPRHLLGSVPVLFSWEFTSDPVRTRRLWSAILNSFLHPTLEKFLYSAEHRLRAHKVKNPLLIYRNDGASSRVSKSVALKTYSSGPRGGLEGTRALAESYGFQHVLMIDVGGTTTDVGVVEDLRIASRRRGMVDGVEISFELSDVQSKGVGGSSIFRVTNGKIIVGPESVGAAPGPACFGFGGTEATITDVNLLLGVLDPNTYLNGELKLDPSRSKQVIMQRIAEPLGVTLEEALLLMEEAYAEKIAESFADQVHADGSTVLAAFGGGGPMSACLAARAAGVRRVIIPRLAAVFSAFGISFSDISQTFEADITGLNRIDVEEIRDGLLTEAERHMFHEGYELSECELRWDAIIENADGSEKSRTAYENTTVTAAGERLVLSLEARYALAHPSLNSSIPTEKIAAIAMSERTLLTANGTLQAEVYDLESQEANASAEGPAIIEGPFFTARVPEGWVFSVSASGDLLLTDQS